MGEHESEPVEGVESESSGADEAALGGQDESEQVPPAEAEPADAAETTEDEDAAHEKFLETYQPVITRLPQALADERAEETAAEEAAAEHARQMQAERDEVERRKLEAEDARRAEEAAYRDEHYPGT